MLPFRFLSGQGVTKAYLGQEIVESVPLEMPQHRLPLAACNGGYDRKGLRSRGHRMGQRSIWERSGQIFRAGEKPQLRTAPLRNVIADRSAQHRTLCLERVTHRALCGLTRNMKFDLAAGVRRRAQLSREKEPDHGSVCTPTESTGGRRCAISLQLSPASGEA